MRLPAGRQSSRRRTSRGNEGARSVWLLFGSVSTVRRDERHVRTSPDRYRMLYRHRRRPDSDITHLPHMLWLLAKGGIAMDNLVYPLGHSEFELERLKTQARYVE